MIRYTTRLTVGEDHIVDGGVLSLEHNSHNEKKGLVLFVQRVQCAAKDQAPGNHQNFPKRYTEENGYKRL